MVIDFFTFIKESYSLIVSNPWTFFFLSVFCFSIGFILAWKLHNYLLEKKLYNIPERESLKSENDSLKEKIHTLENELRQQKNKSLVQDSLKNFSHKESIGKIIRRNNKE